MVRAMGAAWVNTQLEREGLARLTISLLVLTTVGCLAYTWGYAEGVHNTHAVMLVDKQGMVLELPGGLLSTDAGSSSSSSGLHDGHYNISGGGGGSSSDGGGGLSSSSNSTLELQQGRRHGPVRGGKRAHRRPRRPPAAADYGLQQQGPEQNPHPQQGLSEQQDAAGGADSGDGGSGSNSSSSSSDSSGFDSGADTYAASHDGRRLRGVHCR